jgi:hypothetical protein
MLCQNLLECGGGGDGGSLYPNNDHRTRLLLQACYSIHFRLKNMISTFSMKDFCGEKKVGPNSQDFEILEKNCCFHFWSIAKFG